MKNNGYSKKNNANKKGQNNPFTNVAREQKAAKKAEVLEKQKKTLDILIDAMGYVDGLLAKENEDGTFTKIKIRDIIDYLAASYSVEDTKSLSKFNYILIDLANAQRNKYINKERIDLRILYLKEIIESSFDKSYYDTIYATMDKCPRLLSNYTFTATTEEATAPGIVYEEIEEEK